QPLSLADAADNTKLVVVPLIDLEHCSVVPVRDLATAAHARGARLVVDATAGLGGIDLRVDDWRIDACTAAVDYCLGAPAGMSLVTYSDELEAQMCARSEPPPTSYLDLLQLQAY